MTPLHCGNFVEGYRTSAEYGGSDGITVGTAVAVSGAAANPNMGSNSSPAISFLLALFNLRLGVWLGNTNRNGDKSWKRSGPDHSIRPMLADLFGWTNDKRAYIDLSDGGHFENLGLYEVVLRRCRHVVVCDAGEDSDFSFEDLGNAIRKIRIDFGIPVEFETAMNLLPRSAKGQGVYCAIGTIKYSKVDENTPDGQLVYIKPTLAAVGPQIPYDVVSYARASQAFPHETTADQWFTESQFESYRALGCHALGQMMGDKITPLGVPELIRLVRKYLKKTKCKTADVSPWWAT
jgi:hypothetical protein